MEETRFNYKRKSTGYQKPSSFLNWFWDRNKIYTKLCFENNWNSNMEIFMER